MLHAHAATPAPLPPATPPDVAAWDEAGLPALEAVPWAPQPWPGPGELHLWPWARDWLATQAPAQPGWLSPDEQARLQRMPSATRQDQALRVRCTLRAVLGGYVGTAPAAVLFAYGSHGKPSLAEHPGLQFSLSHAGGHALLAVSSTSPVGLDLERVRHPPRDHLAERLLGPQALADYQQQALAQRCASFAQAWSEREALVKAMGLGIGDGWGLCQALFAHTGVSAALGPHPVVGGWHLRALPVWPGWAATVCTASPPAGLRWLLPGPEPPG